MSFVRLSRLVKDSLHMYWKVKEVDKKEKWVTFAKNHEYQNACIIMRPVTRWVQLPSSHFSLWLGIFMIDWWPTNQLFSSYDSKKNWNASDLKESWAWVFYLRIQHFFRVQEIGMNEFRIAHNRVVHGLLPGVKLDVVFPGFPTMKHIKHTAELHFADIKVFQQPSKKQSMILKVVSRPDFEKVSCLKIYWLLKIPTSLVPKE